MSGHSKWSQIKHQKAAADAKRGQAFSKLSKTIALAAKEGGTDPASNTKLRDAITKAKQANMPADNIQRAIARATTAAEGLETFLYEAYGPGGVALLIEGVSDNRNRSAGEIKHLLAEHGAKWAEPGSVQWAFRKTNAGWEAQEHSRIEVNEEDQKKLKILLDALEEQEDVEEIYTNVKNIKETNLSLNYENFRH
ncbi:MAG: YebC/PmpR family DNA-binding transcriptional regulator [Patescibacteria group bacterium]|jgi:YebC/PmpR family DNA-binding regulatory protein